MMRETSQNLYRFSSAETLIFNFSDIAKKSRKGVPYEVVLQLVQTKVPSHVTKLILFPECSDFNMEYKGKKVEFRLSDPLFDFESMQKELSEKIFEFSKGARKRLVNFRMMNFFDSPIASNRVSNRCLSYLEGMFPHSNLYYSIPNWLL